MCAKMNHFVTMTPENAGMTAKAMRGRRFFALKIDASRTAAYVGFSEDCAAERRTCIDRKGDGQRTVRHLEGA